MNRPLLFEISWEVCNKVGGIHTVLSTKAKTAVERYADDYVAVGPWLLTESPQDVPFQDDPAHTDFAEACRSMGLPVKVGRWLTTGRPRVILVEFSRLYEHKDDVLAQLWEGFGVDSISGSWDYVEPVLFGHAAGRVIERYCEDFVAPVHGRVIVHAHEWMTSAALLYLKRQRPEVATVFTTHATMLGRALSSTGHSPQDGLGGQSPADLAETHHVVAKHSIEGICAREADVFTTVSEVTADESELLHERRPDPLLPNGIDLEVIDETAGPVARDVVRAELVDSASRFCGEDVSDALLACVSGRYEFHNKGIDLLLDAAARLEDGSGPRLVLFVLVPAGNSGIKSELLERRGRPIAELDGPVGISTHNLFDADDDPVHRHCAHLGLANPSGSRVKVIQVPIYLRQADGLWNHSYEAVLRAMDVSCFPSFYEPWGYTPQESLAVGVPTVTTDYAGFGRWALAAGLDADSGITVLRRVGVPHADAVNELVAVLERFVARDGLAAADRCRETAARTAWSDLFAHYQTAYAKATELAGARARDRVATRKPAHRALTARAPASQRPHLHRFDVAASLPEALAGLSRLSRNFWWSWNRDAEELFASLAPELWVASRRNPVAFLQSVDADVLAARASDHEYLAGVAAVLQRFDAYLAEAPSSFQIDGADGAAILPAHPVAYFSAEFGIHESLPIYSGGLGVLAGDHLKSASDLGVPLVAVGLFYRMGYMGQRLSAAGEQIAIDVENDPRQLPLECVRDADGTPLEVAIRLPSRTLFLRAWRVAVGRVSLYLLDADTPSNRAEDRDVTRNLYGGEQEMRIQQEIALGRGGVRLLRRLGLRPAVCHMNEGHAAFLTLERVARLVREEGLTFEAAREVVRGTTAFTTHTPVPAGHDRFDEDLMRRYFSDAEEWVGVPWERFYELGRADDDAPEFNMTYLALNFAGRVNGVSQLHGTVSRQLLHPFWPGLLEDEVPIRAITNGVHLPTWTGPEVAKLIGAGEPVRGTDFATCAKRVEPRALWGARRAAKDRLHAKLRASLEHGFVSRNDSPITLSRILEGLDQRALWIGFARRFAPYKRAHLLTTDIERLRALLDDPERPVRVFVAGKAHPLDSHGQSILRGVAELARSDDLRGRLVFVEDYDIELARALVQGVDVWLNTPTRKLEASGTSGMKAAANGVLNLSVADGWWPEAADGRNGWTIGGERLYADQELQDQFDASALYRLLEEEIVPLFYERDADDVPLGWLERVVHDLESIPPRFDTDRMVRDYVELAYRPLAAAYLELGKDRKAEAKRRAIEQRRIAKGFGAVRIVEAHVADVDGARVGDPIDARLVAELGELSPDDVQVELVFGRSCPDRDCADPVVVGLDPNGQTDAGAWVFEGRHTIPTAGRFACGLRVRPRADGLPGGTRRGLVLWA